MSTDTGHTGLRERKKHKARNDILDAARLLIERQGFENTTMRDIADAADVSYQTLYNYYASKAQVVQALLSRETDPIVDRLNALFADAEIDLVDHIHAATKLLFDVVAQRDRHLWREVVVLVFRDPSDFFAHFFDHYTMAQVRIARLFERARQHGKLDPGVDVTLLAQTLYAIIDFAFLQYVADPGMSKAAVLKRLRGQVALLLKPYRR